LNVPQQFQLEPDNSMMIMFNYPLVLRFWQI
jgi:hypothetical protein